MRCAIGLRQSGHCESRSCKEQPSQRHMCLQGRRTTLFSFSWHITHKRCSICCPASSLIILALLCSIASRESFSCFSISSHCFSPNKSTAFFSPFIRSSSICNRETSPKATLSSFWSRVFVLARRRFCSCSMPTFASNILFSFISLSSSFCRAALVSSWVKV